jgi:hypothetical protein
MSTPPTKFSQFKNKGPDNIASYEYEAIDYLSDLEPFEGNLFWAGNFSSGSIGTNGASNNFQKRNLTNAEFRIQTISLPSVTFNFTENQNLRRNFFTGITRATEISISWIEDAYMSVSKYHNDWLCNWYDLRHDCFIVGPSGKYRKLDIYLYHYAVQADGTMKPQIIAQYKMSGLVPTMVKYPDLTREGGNPIININYKVGKCEVWYNPDFLRDKTGKDIANTATEIFNGPSKEAQGVWSPITKSNSQNGFENTNSSEAHRLAHAFVLDLPSEGSLV